MRHAPHAGLASASGRPHPQADRRRFKSGLHVLQSATYCHSSAYDRTRDKHTHSFQCHIVCAYRICSRSLHSGSSFVVFFRRFLSSFSFPKKRRHMPLTKSGAPPSAPVARGPGKGGSVLAGLRAASTHPKHPAASIGKKGHRPGKGKIPRGFSLLVQEQDRHFAGGCGAVCREFESLSARDFAVKGGW